MARIGSFDPELNQLAWFSTDAVPEGWFDGDLIDADGGVDVARPSESGGGGAAKAATSRRRIEFQGVHESDEPLMLKNVRIAIALIASGALEEFD